MIIKTEKGQEFTIFKLLIASVFATAILAILVSVINEYSSINAELIIPSISEGLKTVDQSLGGQEAVREGVKIPKDFIISSGKLAFASKLAEDKICLNCNDKAFLTNRSSSPSCPTECVAQQRFTANIEICIIGTPPNEKYWVDVEGTPKKC